MITSLKAWTKSAGLIAGFPITKSNANDISVLPVPTPPNFTGSNNKKKRKQSWRRASCISCHHKVNEKRLLQRSICRRQLLLASTSLPLQPQQMMTAVMPPSLSLTDYHKLTNVVQEAEKSNKVSHGPLKAPKSKSTDELSGLIPVPRAEELPDREMNETEVVTARIRRVAALKRTKEKEEQLVLQGIEITNDKPLCFHVYIRLGQEPEDEEEYVGTFSHMPPRRRKQLGCHNNKQDFDGNRDNEQKRVRRCCLTLGINGILIHPHNLINAYQEETVIVKLVPALKLDNDPIKVESIFIDYT